METSGFGEFVENLAFGARISTGLTTRYDLGVDITAVNGLPFILKRKEVEKCKHIV